MKNFEIGDKVIFNDARSNDIIKVYYEYLYGVKPFYIITGIKYEYSRPEILMFNNEPTGYHASRFKHYIKPNLLDDDLFEL